MNIIRSEDAKRQLARLSNMPNQARGDFEGAGFRGYSERRSGAPIKRLVVSGAVDVYWRRSAASMVVVAGETQAACDAIETRFNGSTLKVSGPNGGVSVINGIGASIHLGSAGGDIYINGVRVSVPNPGRAALFIAQSFAPDVELRGSSDLLMQGVDQERLSLAVVGSADLDVDGRLDQLDVSVSGSGNVRAKSLIAQHVNFSVSGSGDLSLYAAQSVRGRVPGSGDVTVRGMPAIRDTSVSGSGDIRFKKT